MAKKDGGVRPIAVGYTLRRLAAKCANRHVIEGRCKVLQPKQVGVGVAGAAEAVVHAMRRYVAVLPAEHAIVKLDFSNAFSSIRRQLLLDTMAKNIPELYRFTLAKYSCEPTHVYGEHTIPFREGSKQVDSVSSLEFCEAIQPVLDDFDSELDIGFIDDLSLSSDLSTLKKDVDTIS